jgi:hypothetical protein
MYAEERSYITNIHIYIKNQIQKKNRIKEKRRIKKPTKARREKKHKNHPNPVIGVKMGIKRIQNGLLDLDSKSQNTMDPSHI